MNPVRIEDITKRFGNTVALDHVSLEIREGEIFFLLGPSGCGKTTLLRIIAGLTEPDGGKVLIGDEDITHKPAHLRRLAMVFQNYALWPHMTVGQNVQFAMTVKGVVKRERTRKAGQALKIVHMERHAEKKPAQLSGGEQQRVALARAVAADPLCLLLDEPLSNLDANLRIEMRTEIRRICKQTEMTTIYVTHDQKEALSIADRIAVLNKGRVEQVAAPGELYRNPATKFVAGFVGESNFLQGKVESTGKDGAVVRVGSALVRGAGFPAGLAGGHAAVCSIRPEKITIAGAAASGEKDGSQIITNEVRGRIRSITFLGEITQYDIAIDDTLQLKVMEAAPEKTRSEGEDVVLLIDPKDVNVYCDE